MNDETMRAFFEQARAQAELRRALLPDVELLDRFRYLSERLRGDDIRARLAEATRSVRIDEIVRANTFAVHFRSMPDLSGVAARIQEEFSSGALRESLDRLSFTREAIERAMATARLTERLSIPTPLLEFRLPTEELVARLSMVDTNAFDEAHRQAFTETSALANAFRESAGLVSSLRAAMEAFSASTIPHFEALRSYGRFLDAAGLDLPHWPRPRLLTRAEKRRRFKARLARNAAPPHVKRAKTLIHEREVTLREIVDAVMAETYGEDWAEHRLEACGCKDLLGKWKAKGGEALEHADYAHYVRIMIDPEHFEAIFSAGFDDPDALAALLKKAGSLRAQSHHARPFAVADLRDLRVTWRALESGLLAFTPDYTLDAGDD